MFGELRFTEGLPSGEDVAFVTRMWFSGAPLAFDRTGPAYLENDDATDRVSFTLRSVADDYATRNPPLSRAFRAVERFARERLAQSDRRPLDHH